MQTRRTWLASFALITFVVGGMIMPVLHRVDHAAEWYEQQAAAHRHDQPASESMGKACADLAADLQHCHLCQRDFFSDLIPDLVSAADLPSESHVASVPHGISLSLDAFSPIRAPPVTA